MSKIDDIADKVLRSIGNDQEKARKITDALVTKDPGRIQQVLAEVAGVQLTKEDLDGLTKEIESNPKRVAAIFT